LQLIENRKDFAEFSTRSRIVGEISITLDNRLNKLKPSERKRPNSTEFVPTGDNHSEKLPDEKQERFRPTGHCVVLI
jgi:hypothetical protein